MLLIDGRVQRGEGVAGVGHTQRRHAGGDDGTLDAALHRRLQDVECCARVIAEGLLSRVAQGRRVCRQVHHPLAAFQGMRHLADIEHVHGDEMRRRERAGRRVAVGGRGSHPVRVDYLVPVIHQVFHHPTTDTTTSTCDQHAHRSCLPRLKNGPSLTIVLIAPRLSSDTQGRCPWLP